MPTTLHTRQARELFTKVKAETDAFLAAHNKEAIEAIFKEPHGPFGPSLSKEDVTKHLMIVAVETGSRATERRPHGTLGLLRYDDEDPGNPERLHCDRCGT